MSRRTLQTNRRGDLLAAALEAFIERGYQGTSVADLARATELSKAAFVYHFASKEQLLFELSAPLLNELDEVVAEHEARNDDEAAADLLEHYLEVLWRHRHVAAWVDGDKSILNHDDLGARIDANNRRAHCILTGSRPSPLDRARASAILGMLWRPIRNGHLDPQPDSRRALADLAANAAATL